MSQKAKTAASAKTMAHATIGQIVLVVHGEAPPADDEWAAYVNTLGTLLERGGIEQLVMTTGGGPNATQRKMLNDVVRGRHNRVAVSTASSMVRGIVTAISWFNSQISAFPPNRLAEALNHLGVAKEKIPTLIATAQELHGELGGENVRLFAQQP